MLHIICLAVSCCLPPAVELDFGACTTGQRYDIAVVLRDAGGNILVSGPVEIGPGLSMQEVRGLIANVLGDSGLDIAKAGDTKLRLVSKDGVKLGAITYDTFVKGLPTALAGPKLLSATGGATLTVNGTQVNP